MLPVSQAPVSDVDVWVGPVLFVHVTLEPAVIRIGFGLKQPNGLLEQVTIWADVLAAAADTDTASTAVSARATITRTFRMMSLPKKRTAELTTRRGYAPLSLPRIISWSNPLLATAFPPAYVRRPVKSVSRPPASSTMMSGAARSQGASSGSIIPSPAPSLTRA